MDVDSKIINLSDVNYKVFKEGRVFSCKTGKEISQRPNKDGYATFTAGKKGKRTRIRTHRIVAQLFVDNPNNYDEIDHLDCNRMNPAASNLEWVTHQENIRRAYARGNHEGRITGEKNPKARLTESLVRQMRAEYSGGACIKDIADRYGYAWSTVGNAVKAKTWPHLK